MINDKKNIFEKEYIPFLLLLPFFEPVYVNHIPLVYNIFLWGKIISFLFVLFLFIKSRIKITADIKLTLIFYSLILTSTILNELPLKNYTSYLLHVFIVILAANLWCKFSPISFLGGLNKLLVSISSINLVSVLLFPSGLFYEYDGASLVSYYFMGLDNQFASFALPSSIISLINSQLKYNKISLLCLFQLIIHFTPILYLWSATGVIGVLIICFLVILSRKKLLFLNSTTHILTILFFFFFFYQIVHSQNNLITNFVTEQMGKSITFSNRIYLWESAINMISEKPILGHGLANSDSVVETTVFWGTKKNAHNFFLQIGIIGGISSLFVFILLSYNSLKQVTRERKHVISYYLFSGIVSFLLCSMMEVYRSSFMLFLLFALSYNIKHIIHEKNRNHNISRIK